MMLTTPSIFKGGVDDPCQYYMKGEPLDFPSNYVKIHLYCSPTHLSSNSLALPALKDATLLGIIKELGRIQGFEVIEKGGKIISLGSLSNDQEREWRCVDLGEKKLTFLKFDYKVRPRENIGCFFLTISEIIKVKK